MSHRFTSCETQLFHDFQGMIDGPGDLNVLNRHPGLFAGSGSLFWLLLCRLYRLHKASPNYCCFTKNNIE